MPGEARAISIACGHPCATRSPLGRWRLPSWWQSSLDRRQVKGPQPVSSRCDTRFSSSIASSSGCRSVFRAPLPELSRPGRRINPSAPDRSTTRWRSDNVSLAKLEFSSAGGWGQFRNQDHHVVEVDEAGILRPCRRLPASDGGVYRRRRPRCPDRAGRSFLPR
jgi:hypothetical protein